MGEPWGLEAVQLDLLQFMGIRLWQQRVDLPGFPVDPQFWLGSKTDQPPQEVLPRMVQPPQQAQYPAEEKYPTEEMIPVAVTDVGPDAMVHVDAARLLLAALGPQWLVVGVCSGVQPWPSGVYTFLQDLAGWLEAERAAVEPREFLIPDGIPPGVQTDLASLRSWVQGGGLRMARNRRILMFSGGDFWMPALAQQKQTRSLSIGLLTCIESVSAKRQLYRELLSWL